MSALSSRFHLSKLSINNAINAGANAAKTPFNAPANPVPPNIDVNNPAILVPLNQDNAIGATFSNHAQIELNLV